MASPADPIVRLPTGATKKYVARKVLSAVATRPDHSPPYHAATTVANKNGENTTTSPSVSRSRYWNAKMVTVTQTATRSPAQADGF